jgi:tRNA A37 threonylcarbamoyladenosine dehydratase
MNVASKSTLQLPRWLDRTTRLLGADAVRRLRASHVAVFGLGGVGSYAVEGLARSGIGTLTLVDFDDVCVTNINRQLPAFPATVGHSKAELMAHRVQALDPDIRVRGLQAFYEAATADTLLEPRPDYVVDCIDNVTAKMHLLVTCMERGIPVVTCLGASAKVDPSQVRVAPLADTFADPLARAIRKNLGRKHKVDVAAARHVTAVFSTEPFILPDDRHSGALCGVECVCPGGANKKHSCTRRHVVHGSAVFVTAVFGMTAAGVVVRELAGPIEPGRRPQGEAVTPPPEHMRRKQRTTRTAKHP